MGHEEGGYRRVAALEVKIHSEQIGHALDADPDVDQLDKGGWPGIADATHAEKQAALGSPHQPIGVNYRMCDSCQDFFSKHAAYTQRVQYVADSEATRIFYPNGTGKVVAHVGTITLWVNFYIL